MAARASGRPRETVREWEDDGSTDPGTAAMVANGITETKAGRRRRDLVTRIEKVRESNFAKREDIYAQTWKELNDAQIALAVNPPTHVPFLLALHRESLKRDNDLLAARVYHDALLAAARSAYEAEVRNVEEEFAAAKAQAREKLLDALEERRKKLKDEKDLVDFSEEATAGGQRTRATKGLRNRGMAAVLGGTPGARTAIFSRASSVVPGTAGGGRNGGTPDLMHLSAGGVSNLLDGVSADLERSDSHPLGAVSSALKATALLASSDDPLLRAVTQISEPLRDSPVFQQLLILGTQSKGRGGKRGALGLPSSTAHLNVQPGLWINHLKSNPGIAPTREEEKDLDLAEVRRSLGQGTKKRRGAALASATKKKTRDDY